VYNIFGTFYLYITNSSLFRKVVSPVYSGKEVHDKLNQTKFQYIVCLTIGCYNAFIQNLPSGDALYADLEGESAAGF
jgi:hypothetical protein